jgi:hypothetical protein
MLEELLPAANCQMLPHIHIVTNGRY